MSAHLLLALLLTGCPAPAEIVPPKIEAPAQGAAEAAEIAAAAQAWRASPSPARLGVVQAACERGLAVEQPSATLDLTLGDALANVMLRPDLGVPRFEPHLDGLDPVWHDAWLGALLRAQALPRLAAEHQRLRGSALDVDHAAAVAYASQAAHDGALSWHGLPDAVGSARLVEAALAVSRRSIDRPTDAVAPMFEALSIVLDGWPIHAVVARTAFPDDPDPMLVSGEIIAADGRRRVLASARSAVPAEVRAPAARIDADRPPRVVTLAVEALAPGGGRILLASEMDLRDGGVWLFSTNDPARLEAWVEAGELLAALRARGTPEADIAAQLRERYATILKLGEVSLQAP